MAVFLAVVRHPRQERTAVRARRHSEDDRSLRLRLPGRQRQSLDLDGGSALDDDGVRARWGGSGALRGQHELRFANRRGIGRHLTSDNRHGHRHLAHDLDHVDVPDEASYEWMARKTVAAGERR
jgi:hypothetical protein